MIKIVEENQIKLSRLLCSVHQFSLILQCNSDIPYLQVVSTLSDFLQQSLGLLDLASGVGVGRNPAWASSPVVSSWEVGTSSARAGRMRQQLQN